MTEKHCTACTTTKAVKDFDCNKASKDGYCWNCKPCKRTYERNRRKLKRQLRK